MGATRKVRVGEGAEYPMSRPTASYVGDGINWTLINDLHEKPHPLLNIHDHGHECCPYVGEVLYDARTAHHLLDIAGVPRGKGYSSDVDARTYLLLAEVIGLRERLDRIATWHARETGPSGTVGDCCTECGETWPCETRQMADGTHEDCRPIEIPEQSAAIVDANLTRMGLTLGGIREPEAPDA